jgi:hypothetical protein
MFTLFMVTVRVPIEAADIRGSPYVLRRLRSFPFSIGQILSWERSGKRPRNDLVQHHNVDTYRAVSPTCMA